MVATERYRWVSSDGVVSKSMVPRRAHSDAPPCYYEDSYRNSLAPREHKSRHRSLQRTTTAPDRPTRHHEPESKSMPAWAWATSLAVGVGALAALVKKKDSNHKRSSSREVSSSSAAITSRRRPSLSVDRRETSTSRGSSRREYDPYQYTSTSSSNRPLANYTRIEKASSYYDDPSYSHRGRDLSEHRHTRRRSHSAVATPRAPLLVENTSSWDRSLDQYASFPSRSRRQSRYEDDYLQPRNEYTSAPLRRSNSSSSYKSAPAYDRYSRPAEERYTTPRRYQQPSYPPLSQSAYKGWYTPQAQDYSSSPDWDTGSVFTVMPSDSISCVGR